MVDHGSFVLPLLATPGTVSTAYEVPKEHQGHGFPSVP